VTSPADEAALRERNEALIGTIMELISTGHFDDVVELLADDFTFELPYGPAGMPPSFDRATYAGLQTSTFKMFSAFELEPVELHRTLDPDALVAEYRSNAVVAASGEPYRNRYIGVFAFRDGKVRSWKEFHNPDATRVLGG
jgi:ketosteroid isomerase-like protein